VGEAREFKASNDQQKERRNTTAVGLDWYLGSIVVMIIFKEGLDKSE